MLGFADARIDERTALIVNEVPDRSPGIHAGELLVVVTAPDELAAEGPEVVAMPVHGRLGQTPVQQMKQERREHADDLLADFDVRRLVVP